MAYVAFDESGYACLPAGATRHLAVVAAGDDRPVIDDARLSALEWSIVAIARFDPLSSLRRPGRLARALGAMFGRTTKSHLANERLEALRRLAVLSWHRADAITADDLRVFCEAGFTTAQYDAMRIRIGIERANGSR